MNSQESATAKLRVRTDASQMNDVIQQLSKEFLMVEVPEEATEKERTFFIEPRMPPDDLPTINVTFLAAEETIPVSPTKIRSIFCNPIYAGLKPLIFGIVDDETWIGAAAVLARRDGVEQFLVNMLYTLQTSLGVEGKERSTDDAPSPDGLSDYSANDVNIKTPISLRLQADRERLKTIVKRLRLAFVLSEQKTTGRAGTKHFAASLGDRSRDLPSLKAKYIYPDKIVSEALSSTDMNVRRNLLGNPMYTGVATFPRFVSNQDWVHGAAYLVREEGIEQFLVNMLYLMRRSIRDFIDE